MDLYMCLWSQAPDQPEPGGPSSLYLDSTSEHLSLNVYIHPWRGSTWGVIWKKSALLTAKQNAIVSSDTIGKPWTVWVLSQLRVRLPRLASLLKLGSVQASPACQARCGPCQPTQGALQLPQQHPLGGTGFLMLPTAMPGPRGPQQAAAVSTMGLSVRPGSWGEAVRLKEARKDFEVRQS